MTSTALAVIEAGGYLALNNTPEEVAAIIADNLGGQDLTEFDLARVKVPSGGATTWEIPGIGGMEPAKTLEGIVVHWKLTRAYWTPESDSGTPPACRSENAIIGIGDPGGSCKTCPHAQYGTAFDDAGRPAPGQACNAKEIWFLLRPGSYLPIVVALPATSLKAAKSYRVSQLASAGIRLPSVVTRIALTPAKNAKGDPYAIVSPTVGGVLSPEEAERALAYAADLKPVFDAAAAAMATERNGAVDSSAEEG